MRGIFSFAVAAAFAASALGGCGGPAPEARPERALYRDLRRIVDARARTDWVADRFEFQEVAPAALKSACQTDPEARQRLVKWLDAQIAAEGGPAAAQFAANGGDLEPLEEVIVLERVRGVLLSAEPKDCPFFLRPDPEFAGVQGSADRFVLMAESMGGLQVLVGEADTAYGGTGAGRLIPAWGLNDRLTLGLGAELGVASTFPKDESGARGLRPAFSQAVPLLLRVTTGAMLWDSEVALTNRTPEGDPDRTHFGYRLSQGVGIAALRIGSFMPYAVIWAGYEYLPGERGEPDAHGVRGGTRFGLDWDP